MNIDDNILNDNNLKHLSNIIKEQINKDNLMSEDTISDSPIDSNLDTIAENISNEKHNVQSTLQSSTLNSKSNISTLMLQFLIRISNILTTTETRK
jgi:hypothetical protein